MEAEKVTYKVHYSINKEKEKEVFDRLQTILDKIAEASSRACELAELLKEPLKALVDTDIES